MNLRPVALLAPARTIAILPVRPHPCHAPISLGRTRAIAWRPDSPPQESRL
jgi:hypothetical protein